jgi:YegS/Rv2252/BmrU family lipid kinase
VRKAALIYNPKSGGQASGRMLPQVLALLFDSGFEVEPWPTQGPGDATRLGRRAVAQGGIDVVFAMGGDGTVRETAAGILGSEVALGVLPAGTANVLPLAVGVPADARRAAQVLKGAGVSEIDVGRIEGEPFLMMASGGIDAAVMVHQQAALKKLFGRAAMATAACIEWWRYPYPQIALRIDGHHEERASFFAVCNIPFYGGRLRLAPAADCRDGLLDLVLFHGSGRAAMLGFARDLMFGRHTRRRDVQTQRVRAVEVLGPAEIGVQVDGDVLPLRPPLHIDFHPQRLRVLTPSG